MTTKNLNDKPVQMFSAFDLEALRFMLWKDLREGPMLDRAVTLQMETRNSILHTFIRFKKGDRE